MDSRNTKKLKKKNTTRMLSFYKQKSYLCKFVSKKPKNNNTILYKNSQK